MKCEKCGAEIPPGGWPFCSVGKGGHGVVARGRGADVTWPGGKTFENLGHEPQTFYSPAELTRYCKSHGIEPCVRHVPVPGSDKSPHTTSWAAVSQHQLDAATELVSRSSKGKEVEAPTYISHMTFTTSVEPATIRAPRGTFDAT